MKGAWEEKFPPSVDSVSCIGVNSTPQRSVNQQKACSLTHHHQIWPLKVNVLRLWKLMIEDKGKQDITFSMSCS